MQKLIAMSPDELQVIIETANRNVLSEFYNRITSKQGDKLLTINQVRKLTGMSWATIKKYVDDGTIIATDTNRIPESALNEFLKRKQ